MNISGRPSFEGILGPGIRVIPCIASEDAVQSPIPTSWKNRYLQEYIRIYIADTILNLPKDMQGKYLAVLRMLGFMDRYSTYIFHSPYFYKFRDIVKEKLESLIAQGYIKIRPFYEKHFGEFNNFPYMEDISGLYH